MISDYNGLLFNLNALDLNSPFNNSIDFTNKIEKLSEVMGKLKFRERFLLHYVSWRDFAVFIFPENLYSVLNLKSRLKMVLNLDEFGFDEFNIFITALQILNI